MMADVVFLMQPHKIQACFLYSKLLTYKEKKPWRFTGVSSCYSVNEAQSKTQASP